MFIIDVLLRNNEGQFVRRYEDREIARLDAALFTTSSDAFIIVVSEAFGDNSEFGESILCVWHKDDGWVIPAEECTFSQILDSFATYAHYTIA